MAERLGPALQSAYIRALAPHDVFDSHFDDLMPSSTLGKRLHFTCAKRHLPDADEPVEVTGEEYQSPVELIRTDDRRAFVMYFGDEGGPTDEPESAQESGDELDDIMRDDLDDAFLDRPRDDVPTPVRPKSASKPVVPREALPQATIVGGTFYYLKVLDKYQGHGRRIQVAGLFGGTAQEYVPFLETVPILCFRHFHESHGDRGRKPRKRPRMTVRRFHPDDLSGSF